MRMIAAVAFSSAVLLSPVFAAADEVTAATTAPAATAAPAAAAPATAAPAVATPAVTATADSSAPNLDEIVCRQVPATTGSRLGGGRECHTTREWNDRQKQSQDMTREQQRMSSFHPGG